MNVTRLNTQMRDAIEKVRELHESQMKLLENIEIKSKKANHSEAVKKLLKDSHDWGSA
jgi:hypothetical protein